MEHSQEELHDFITKLNGDLYEFIARTIQNESDTGKEWSHLFDIGKSPKCHELIGCSNSNCPVYSNGNNDYRCWLQVGTLCGREVQGTFAQKFGTCVKCEVYTHYQREPVRALYENIDILISHLTGEVGEYRRRSITDRLTGAYNRNYFDELIGREVDKAVRLELPTSFLMIDLDRFKQINDQLGHLTGDHYLKETVKLLKSNIRYSDVVVRIGGDEFLILLVNTSQQESEGCRNRIHHAVEKWNDENERTNGARLSFSIGIATLQPGERDYLAAIQRADALMYSEKGKLNGAAPGERETRSHFA